MGRVSRRSFLFGSGAAVVTAAAGMRCFDPGLVLDRLFASEAGKFGDLVASKLGPSGYYAVMIEPKVEPLFEILARVTSGERFDGYVGCYNGVLIRECDDIHV